VNPDVVAAIARLETEHVLSAGQAALFERVARRRLVSVRFEIRTLLYVGILLVTSGVGIVVAEHHRDIGALATAAAIAVATVACLSWVARHDAPFSWGEVESPHAAFDYVLLLGLMLFATELAYVETQFTVLGPRWPHHLLIVAVVYLLAAYRWDSRTVLGLGLSTLAAWRGLSIGLARGALAPRVAGDLRADAIALGALYVIAAALSVGLARKARFEEVFATAGLLLLLGGLVSGVLDERLAWGSWLIALLAVSAGVMWVAFRFARSLYFAAAVAAAYIGLVHLLFRLFPRGSQESIAFLLTALLGAAGLALIVRAHRVMVRR